MSIPRRLLRAAVQKLREGVDGFDTGWLNEVTGGRPRPGDARRELDDFLRDQYFEPPSAARASPRPPEDPLAAEYRLFGLEPGADLEAVRRAWRRCARENHPDRFSADRKAQAEAAERFLKFQQAYERICAAKEGG